MLDDVSRGDRINLEKELLVGIVFNPELSDIIWELEAFSFTEETRDVFSTLRKMKDEKTPIDLDSVKNSLEENTSLMPSYYAFLEEDRFSTRRNMGWADAQSYARYIRESATILRLPFGVVRERFPRFAKGYPEKALLVGFAYNLKGEKSIRNQPGTEGVFTETKTSDFFFKNHKIIFETIRELVLKTGESNIIAILNKLDEKSAAENNFKPEDYSFLTSPQFESCRSLSFNAARTCLEELRAISSLRILSYESEKIIDKACDAGAQVVELIAYADKTLRELERGENLVFGTLGTAQSAVHSIMKRIETNSFKGSAFYCIPTGFSALDDKIAGLYPGLTVLAGRPQMGASEFALNLAYMLSREKNVLYFSTLDTKDMFTLRLLSTVSRVPMRQLLGAGSDFQISENRKAQLKEAARNLRHHQLVIDALNREDITVKLENLIVKAKYAFKTPPEIIIVDDIMHIDVSKNYEMVYRRPSSMLEKEIVTYEMQSKYERGTFEGKSYIENREEKRLNTVAHSLYVVAQSLGIPVIIVTGCSGDAELRSSGVPRLNNILGTLSTELANTTILFHRPQYYTADSKERKKEESEPVNLIIARNKKGPAPVRVKLAYHQECFRFEDFSEK
ncbi:replicative DNA helicase [Candidatus Woesearchaeota archaeon]|nr:replicative DNA helicase [Candidatus Woesearchaeota archaeon]